MIQLTAQQFLGRNAILLAEKYGIDIKGNHLFYYTDNDDPKATEENFNQRGYFIEQKLMDLKKIDEVSDYFAQWSVAQIQEERDDLQDKFYCKWKYKK
jgi:hypothetical protein